ncbi:TVP38/TMEM64 family protein (plasmid) [Natrinema zhouii]|uniref:TVP38/TMEM64 family protein n=1 Tax=Natrinema zhouii TaxID=1710539 RepID=UPI001D000879|nr:TVP38/TMEM64 family protein [Natrinema zhouii]UHQ98654.1 TVP38/TMEM64 family protein [Natrinema zhouii]
MQVFSSADARKRGILVTVLLLAVFVLLYLSLRRYAPFIFHPDELQTWIDQFGVLAPAAFMFVQISQVVVAPVPGQVVALVAGYLFGSVAGTVYSITGVLIGSVIAFLLADRYGRTFVEDILHEDVVARFDEFVDRVGFPGLVAFVLIPGLPDDAICFLAGLTKWKLRTFMVAITVGRLPAYVLTVYAGGELASGEFTEGAVIIGTVIVASAVGYYKREAIRDLVGSLRERTSS